MKKIMCYIVAATLTVGLAGCSEKVNTDKVDKTAAYTSPVEKESMTEMQSIQDEVILDYHIGIYGTVNQVSDNMISIDNKSEVSSSGEIVLNIDAQNVKIISASTGLPSQLDSIKKDDVIKAYISNVMTMSLPPITNAGVIITDAAGLENKVFYGHIQNVSSADGKMNVQLSDGKTYIVDDSTNVEPFLTRNIVRREDLTKGREVILWTGDSGNVERVILFAEN